MVLGIIQAVGVILFLYLTWRNLNDSYNESSLIAYSWLALLSMVIGGRLVYGLSNWGIWNDNWMDWFSLWQKPGFSYFGAITFYLGLTIWYCKVNDWKLWSFLEDITPMFLLMMIIILVEEVIKVHFAWQMVARLATLVVGYLLGYWATKKYRSWVWYKSGKKGFGFFFTGFVCCCLWGGLGLYIKDSWVMALTYLLFGLIFGVGLFMLGEVLTIKGGKNG